jgi:putative SOS response-associated peptidase YedK
MLGGSFIRRHEHADVGDEAVPAREALPGLFGMVPHWAKDSTIARHTYNARSETVAEKPSFRDAWKKGRHCIIPADAFFEPDWRSGKAVPTRIARVDGEPMGVAGLWERWVGPEGEVIDSYALLTVNANSHALMHRYQQPGSEKRMPVILNEGAFDAWLDARPEKASEFMRAYAANALTANPVEKLR